MYREFMIGKLTTIPIAAIRSSVPASLWVGANRKGVESGLFGTPKCDRILNRLARAKILGNLNPRWADGNTYRNVEKENCY